MTLLLIFFIIDIILLIAILRLLMDINIKDPSQVLSHVLLQDRSVASKVRGTEQFQKDKTITATVQMNGVEVPASVLEDVLKRLFGQVEARYRERYSADAFDKRVEEKAKELLQQHADNALDKLHQLADVLSDSENLLTPYWERNNPPAK